MNSPHISDDSEMAYEELFSSRWERESGPPHVALGLVLTKSAAKKVYALGLELDDITGDLDVEDLNEIESQAYRILEDWLDLGRSSFICHLRNAGPGKQGGTIVEVAFATDSGGLSNDRLLARFHRRHLVLTGLETTERGTKRFLVIDTYLKRGRAGNKSMHCKEVEVNFYTPDSAPFFQQGFPPGLLHEIAQLPQAREKEHVIDERLADWQRYIEILGRMVRAKMFRVAYKGYKPTRKKDQLTFVLAADGENIPWQQIKAAIDSDLHLVSAGNRRDEKLGTLDRVNEKAQTFTISIEPGLLEAVQDLEQMLPQQGEICYKAIGELSELDRLQQGIRQLSLGKAANPRLGEFLFDIDQANTLALDKRPRLTEGELLSSRLNEQQKIAVEGALSCPDIYLIKGPPGTGKTTVIAELCYQVAKRGGRTLVASQTNLAVDNALDRLMHDPSIRILRHGREASFEEEGRAFSERNVVSTWLAKTAKDCDAKWRRRRSLVQALSQVIGTEQSFTYFVSDERATEFTLLEVLQSLPVDRVESLVTELPDLLQALKEITEEARGELVGLGLAESVESASKRLLTTKTHFPQLRSDLLDFGQQMLVLRDLASSFAENHSVWQDLLADDVLIEQQVQQLTEEERRLEEEVGSLKAWQEHVFSYKSLASDLMKEAAAGSLDDLGLFVEAEDLVEKLHLTEVVGRAASGVVTISSLEKAWPEVVKEVDKPLSQWIRRQKERTHLEADALQMRHLASFCAELRAEFEFALLGRGLRAEDIDSLRTGQNATFLDDEYDMLNGVVQSEEGLLRPVPGALRRLRLTANELLKGRKLATASWRRGVCLFSALEQRLNQSVSAIAEVATQKDSVEEEIAGLANDVEQAVLSSIRIIQEQIRCRLANVRAEAEQLVAKQTGIRSKIAEMRPAVERERQLHENQTLQLHSHPFLAANVSAFPPLRKLQNVGKGILAEPTCHQLHDKWATLLERTEQTWHSVRTNDLLGQLRTELMAFLEQEKEFAFRYGALADNWISRLWDRQEKDEADLRRVYIENTNVIGTTCSQAGARSFSDDFGTFDLVIVDEVSKAIPPELIMPLLNGKRVVLVGDDRQLHPMIGVNTVKELAEESGCREEDLDHLERSLFAELWNEAPEQVKTMLTTQYRMHPTIMHAINQFYDDKLECGIIDPDVSRAHGCGGGRLSEEFHAYWVDTPASPGFTERKRGTSYENKQEVKAIANILADLDQAWGARVAAGAPPKEVGVITFYGTQAKRLEVALAKDTYDNLELRIGTVDRFQGMERPIIIVSMVRNNNRGDIGFARSPERLNVALSRAQELLVLVGCARLFCQDARGEKATTIYRNVVDVLQREGAWIHVHQFLQGR